MRNRLETFARDIGSRIIQSQPVRGSFSAYLIALALVGTALLARLLLAPLDAGYQYVTFFPAVALAAIIGGFWPGVFVAISGAVFAEFFFTQPYYAFSIGSLKTSFWSIMVFLLDGLIVSLSIETMHRYRAKSTKEFQEVQAQNSQIRQLQQETERLLQRNQLLMMNSMDGIHIMDMQGNIVLANDAFCRMLGYTQEEVVKLNVADWDALHSEDLPSRFNDLIGKNIMIETVHRCKNGDLIDVEINVTGVLIEGQGLIYSSSRDVTERHKAEVTLREHDALLNAVMKILPVGVWVTDKTGNIVFGNDAAQEIWGRRHYVGIEQFSEYKGWWLASGKLIKPHEWAAARAIETGESSLAEEIEIECFDGTRKIILNSALPLMGNGGEISGAVIVNEDITQRKHQDEEISQARMALEDLYDRAPCGYHSLDSDGRIIRINQTEASWLGYERAELLGRKIQEFQTPSSLLTFAENYPLYKENGRIDNVEYELVRKDGSTFPILLSATMVKDADGNFVMSRSSMIDISERKQAEAALLSSEANLRAILDNSPYLAWLKDAEGRYIMINKAFADHLRLQDARQAIGKTDLDFQPRELAEKYRADDADVMEKLQRKHIEEAVFDDNNTLWVETYKTPIIDAQGKVLGTVGFASDITERKATEETKLQDSDLRFRGTLEQVAVGIIHASLDGCFQQANQKFCEIIGYSREELLQMNFREITFFADRAGEEEHLLQLLAGKISTFSREQRYVRKDQSFVWINLTVSLLCKTDEMPAYYIGVIEDIAERKHAEVLAQQYGNLLQSSFDEIYLFDAHTLRFLLTSEGAEKNLGYSAEELNQLTPLDLKPSFERESFEKRVAPLRSGERQSITFESNHLRKDGTIYLTEVRLQLMNADYPVFMAIVQDITERKQADIEINQSRKLLRELVVQGEALREDERKHIARELHDELGQILTALRMNVALLRIEFGGHDAALLEKIKGITELLDHSIQCTRDVVSHLRPAALDMGIISAIRWLRDEFIKHSDASCILFTPEEEIHLDEALAVSAFRVVQESLTNVARYAEASQVEIILKQDADNFSVTVNDNGKGFDYMAISNHKSFGLLGMRERAIALGGVVNIYSAPQQGTQIFFVVPNKQTSAAMKGDNP